MRPCLWLLSARSDSDAMSEVNGMQACSGLPESGVCDEHTWLLLMGQDAQPEHLDKVFSGESDDEDLEGSGEGKVYLLGEQRWATRSL